MNSHAQPPMYPRPAMADLHCIAFTLWWRSIYISWGVDFLFVVTALLRAALSLIFAHPWQSLRAILPGIGIIVLAFLIIIIPIEEFFLTTGPIQTLGLTLLTTAVLTFSFAVLAVRWHRFALRRNDEPLPWLPSFASTKGYFVKMVVLAGVAAIGPLTLMALFIGASQIMGPLQDAKLIGSLLYAIVYFISMWCVMRCALVLPAAALDVPMRLKESWTLTKPLSGPIFFAYFTFYVLGTVLKLVLDARLGGAAALLALLLQAMLHLSLVSVLYAHLVQAVPLPFGKSKHS